MPIKITPDVQEYQRPEPGQEQEWLETCLQMGRNQRFGMYVTISKRLATCILNLNKGNRPKKKRNSLMLMDALRRGEFILTHQGISITDDGTLNDGQHRLDAIERTGIPADQEITFGALRKEFDWVDQGSQRTSADLSGDRLDDNLKLRCTIAHFVMRELNDEYKGSWNIPNSAIAKYAENLTECGELTKAIAVGNACKKVCTNSHAAAAYLIILNGSVGKPSAAMLDDFFDGVATGAELSKGPILSLRDRLRAKRPQKENRNGVMRTISGKDEFFWVVYMFIFAWNKYVGVPSKRGEGFNNPTMVDYTTLPIVR